MQEGHEMTDVTGWFRHVPRWARTYGAAIGLIAAAVGAQIAVHDWIGNQIPFVFMTPSVLLAAVLLGRGPALLVVAAGAMNAILLYPPVGSWRVLATGNVLAVAIYAIFATAIAFYGGRLRFVTAQADQKLQATQADLRQQVDDLRRLHTLGETLVAAGADLEASMRAVLKQSLEFTAGECGFVAIRRPDGECLHALVHEGGENHLPPSLAAIAVDGGADTATILAALSSACRQAGFAGVHGAPLLNAAGRTMGLIVVKYLQPHELSQREIRLIETCASMGAAMLERSLARDVVIDQERRFTVALDSAVVPFNIVNPVLDADGRPVDMRFVYINPAGARLMNRPVAELIGRTFGEVLPSFWERPGLLERYATVLATREAMRFEIPSSANNPGSWFNVIISPVNGSLAIWFEDITQRKRQEREQAEADLRKDEFLATLAHELRNPLAPIRQGVRIARSASATEAQIRWSHEVIERQVKHMALLLDDLLDVSRISRGTLLLRRSNVELAGVMDAALEVARPHIEASNHHLDVHMPPSKVIVDLDPLRIAQVVGNLLSNAAKYTDPSGNITLAAGIRGDELVVHVADTGIGMTEEQMHQLFEMFAQAPAAIGRSQGGLGIGLALARNLVRLHGGDIEVHSAGIGHGSEFVVRLPGCVADVHDAAAVGETASS